MPGGSDSESDKGDYKKQKDEDARASDDDSDGDKAKREDSRRRSEESERDDRRGGGGGYGGDDPPPIPENEQWSKGLHILLLVTHGLSLLLLIIIVATRSWGIGKILDIELRAGLWDVCCIGCGTAATGEEGCVTWDEFCPDAGTNVNASGILCIFTIIWLAVMLVLQIVMFLKPAKTALLGKCQMILCHVLWFLLMLCWVLWAASHNGHYCEIHKFDAHLYYAWGWMFVLWMWLVHMLTAVFITLKVQGKPLPCGL